jgi:hypothetical protein
MLWLIQFNNTSSNRLDQPPVFCLTGKLALSFTSAVLCDRFITLKFYGSMSCSVGDCWFPPPAEELRRGAVIFPVLGAIRLLEQVLLTKVSLEE